LMACCELPTDFLMPVAWFFIC